MCCFFFPIIFLPLIIFIASKLRKILKGNCTNNSCHKQQVQVPLTPRTDIIETKDNYVVVVDMPGLLKEEIEITFKRNQFNIQNLVIKGERKLDKFVDEKIILNQRNTVFSNVIYFNVPVQEKDVKATYDAGVLRIVIEKDAGNKIKVE